MSEPATSDTGLRGRTKGPRWLLWAVRALLTVGVTWLIIDAVGVTLDGSVSLGQAVPDPSAWLLAASLVALLAGMAVSAWAWGAMAGELGGEAPRLLDSMRIVFSANLGRYLPGRIWQVAGLAIFARRQGVPPAVSVTSAVLGQVFALAAVAALAAPALMGLGGGGRTAGFAALGTATVLALVLTIPGVLRTGVRVAFRLAREPQDKVPAFGPLFAIRWMAVYLMSWIVYGAAFIMLVRGLGIQAGAVALASSFSAAYLMGYVAVFAPAGIGVREGFLVAFLDPHVGPAALGVALIARVWITVAELGSAAPFALWEVARTGREGAPARLPEPPGLG
jgi:hypothetical protein